MTTNVVQIDDFRPHLTTTVVCEHCGNEWVAVFPEGTLWLECGECGEFTRYKE